METSEFQNNQTLQAINDDVLASLDQERKRLQKTKKQYQLMLIELDSWIMRIDTIMSEREELKNNEKIK